MNYQKAGAKFLSKKKFKFCLLLIALTLCIGFSTKAQIIDGGIIPPEETETIDSNIPSYINLDAIPLSKSKIAKAQKIDLDTRLRISVDSSHDARTSAPGDYFKAHVIENFYLPSSPKQLLILKGSYVRGKIVSLKKPSFFSMNGYIEVLIDQLSSPTGEVYSLNGRLVFQKAFQGNDGNFSPIYDKSTTRTGGAIINNSSELTITINESQKSLIQSLVRGDLLALNLEGDSLRLYRGQELQIVLKKKLTLSN